MNRVIAVAAAVSTACVLPAFLLGAMAVRIRRDLGMGESEIGLAFAAFFAAAALASAPGGRLADRGDPAIIIRFAVLASGVTTLLLAGFARSLVAITVCLTVAGVANSVCQSAANLMIVRSLPAHRQGFALAIKQSAIPGATLLSGLAVPALSLTYGWRWGFAVGGGLALATLIWVPRSRGEARPASARRARPARRTGPDVPMRIMVLLAVAVGLGGTAASSLGSFLVSAAVDADVSERLAGLLLTAGSIAGIGVRLIAGARADRREGGHFRVVALMLAGGAAAFAALAIGVPVAYLLAAPLAFCTAWAWPGLFNLAVVRANPSSPATATGITQTGQFVGAVLGPLLFGSVAEHLGYQQAWLMASCIALAAAGAVAAARSRISEPSERGSGGESLT
jgi:MFS family permease